MRRLQGFLIAAIAMAGCSDAHPTLKQAPIPPPAIGVDPFVPIEPDDECAPADSCEDGDPCTENRCVQGACTAAPVPTGLCCDMDTLFEETFDGSDSQVTMQGAGGVDWHVLDTRNASPPTAAYFGDPNAMNYAKEERVTGSATLPPIELPLYRESQLTLRMMALVEANFQYDLIWIEADVLAEDGSVAETRQLLSKEDLPASAYTEFALVVVELEGLAGQTVRLRINFDSVDDNNNNYEGVWIDDLKVVANCPIPTDCGVDADCDDGDACTTNLCSPEGCVQETLCIGPGEATDGPCSGPDASVDCCVSDADCDDGDGTTLDFCEGATCAHSINPDACDTNAECDDTEACTEDACVDGVCQYTGLTGGECCTPDSGVLGSFDNGKLGGIYVTDNLETGIFWGTDKTRASGGEFSLYCGDPVPQTYAIGTRVKSSATTKVLDIPKGGRTMVSFDLFKATRNHRDYDVFQVFALRKGALYPLWSSRSLASGNTDGAWLHVEVPLDTYAGQRIQVRFIFDSVDAPPAALEGTYMDSIGIATVCE